jgi:hypothetical protein
MSARIARSTRPRTSALSFDTNRSLVTKPTARFGVRSGTGYFFVRRDARRGRIGSPTRRGGSAPLAPILFFNHKPANSFRGVFSSSLREASPCLHAHRHARLRSYCRRCDLSQNRSQSSRGPADREISLEDRRDGAMQAHIVVVIDVCSSPSRSTSRHIHRGFARALLAATTTARSNCLTIQGAVSILGPAHSKPAPVWSWPGVGAQVASRQSHC